ncbi:MAG: hypothetical protein PHU62_10090 [Bacteroidales bacterium]|nr:hypothetical protein [Bacteroidales bacterium]MDD4634899.1 hypothetical protein [Bacteroidales bacterium]
MNNKIKGIDGYLIADIAALLTIILFIVFLIYKNSPKYFLSAMAVSALSALLQSKFGKTQIINNTGADIYTKDEIGCMVSTVYTENIKSNIDGIKMNGIVYKIPDGVHAIATKQNSIKVSSIIGRLIYNVRGGMLSGPPDGDWIDLFEK